jgi:GNAT superfamily N-acetyltransferase
VSKYNLPGRTFSGVRVIRYTDSIGNLRPDQLCGFFEGWPNPPSPERHLELLRAARYVVLAIDDDISGRVIGFVYAISDGVLCAYVPLLEVLPDYRKQGIGRELVRRILERLGGHYMIDLICDDGLRPFYEKLGMNVRVGMVIRNYNRQSGM